MIKTIYLNDNDILTAKKFSKECVSTNIDKYASRNQHDIHIIKNQIFIGKIGEYAVYRFLKQYGLNVTKPDVKIYSHIKNWDADLKLDNLKIHVKSQYVKQSQLFGTSWTFQCGVNDKDKLFTNYDDNDYISFVKVFDEYVEIYSIIPFKTLCEKNLFKNPLKDSLKNKKKVVYKKDLTRMGKFNWSYFKEKLNDF